MNQVILQIFSLLYISLVGTLGIASAGILYFADFEDQRFNGAGLNSNALCCPHSVSIVNQPVYVGKYAAKFQLNSNDAGIVFTTWTNPALRAELRWYNTGAKVGSERWYGFSVNVDSTWLDKSNDPNGTIIVQWHGPPDPGETAHSPQLSLVITKEGRWKLVTIYDPLPISTSTSPTKIHRDLGPVTKGVWVTWVVHAKWHYDNTGVLEVWKDDIKVVNYTGPNTYNDQTQITFAFGIYKSWYKFQQPNPSDSLIIYHDQLKIGDENSSYGEVRPRQLADVPAAMRPSPGTPTSLKVVPD